MWGLFLFLMGALAVVIGLLVYQYRRDRQYLKRRTREALGPALKKEIDDEIANAKRRQEKFKQSLENAAKLAKSQDNSLTSK